MDHGLILHSGYAVLGVCFSPCMLYLVHAVPCISWIWCMLYSMYAVHSVCSTRCMLYSVLTHDHGMERVRRIAELCVLK